MVWRGIERATGFAVLAAALELHIAPEAASKPLAGDELKFPIEAFLARAQKAL